MYADGYYFGSHDDCTIYDHHRHPRYVGETYERTIQPHAFHVTVKATLNVAVVVDIDGTVRVRDAGVIASKDDINDAEIRDEHFRRADFDDDALYEAIRDAVPRDAEVAEGDGWSYRRPAPILDGNAPTWELVP